MDTMNMNFQFLRLMMLSLMLVGLAFTAVPNSAYAALSGPKGTCQAGTYIDATSNPKSFSGITGITADSYACITSNGTDVPTTEYFKADGTSLGVLTSTTDITGTKQFITDPSGKTTNVTPPTSCDGVVDYAGNFSTCIFRTFVSGLGSVLMSLTAWLLGLAGLLFDWLVYNTIVIFSSSFYAKVSDGINIGWTAFRDVGNMIIIGMFVFIAISMILGIKKFGDKKMVANLIIIAILINFSLLFTKMVVDFSNFAAVQFYNAAGFKIQDTSSGASTASISLPTGGSASAAPCNPVANNFSSCGIAGAFIAMSGTTGIGNAYGKLNDVAQSSDNGWIALLHGLMASTLFIGAALVLLYGSYVILVRALLIIFLLLTSSLAFASYIIPGKMLQKGWQLWWSSLWKSAILAPLLMVFLFIVTQIAKALSATSTNLGVMATDPNATTVGALFNYLIILGLLFASFKVANSVASGLAGMNIGNVVSGVASIASTAMGMPGVGYAIGRLGFNRADTLQAKAKEATRSSALSFNDAQVQKANAAKFTKQAQDHKAEFGETMISRGWEEQARKATTEAARLESAANQQDRVAARLARRSVRTSNWAATKSYSKRIGERAKQAAKVITTAAPDTAKLREEEQKKVVDQRAPDLQRQQAIIDEARREAAGQKQILDTKEQERNAAQKKRDDALIKAVEGKTGYDHSGLKEEMPKELMDEFRKQIGTISDPVKKSELETSLGNATSSTDIKNVREEIIKSVDEPQRETTRDALLKKETEHESDMRHVGARIDSARAVILQKANLDTAAKADAKVVEAQTELSTKITELGAARTRVNRANTNVSQQEAALKKLESEIAKSSKEAGDAVVKAAEETSKRVAERVGARGVDFIPNFLDRSASAAAAVKTIRTKKTEERLSDILKEVAKENQAAETPSSGATPH